MNHAIDNILYNSLNNKLTASGTIDFVKECDQLEDKRFLSDHLPVFIKFKMKYRDSILPKIIFIHLVYWSILNFILVICMLLCNYSIVVSSHNYLNCLCNFGTPLILWITKCALFHKLTISALLKIPSGKSKLSINSLRDNTIIKSESGLQNM